MGVEERRPEVAVQQQHRDRGGQRRDRQDHEVRVDQHRPHEQRHPAPAHAGRAHVVDRRDEVDRAEDRGQAREVDHVDPRLLPVGWRELLQRQRHVGEPAGLRRREEQRAVQRDAAEQEHPVRPRVQPRERDVARPDHQRDEVVREARPHRHDDQEDHRRPVQREDLVVLLGRQERVLRRPELDPQQQRLDPAEHEEHEDRVEVEDPDLLVIGGRQPRDPAAPRAVDVVGDDLRPRRQGSHYEPSSASYLLATLGGVLLGLLEVRRLAVVPGLPLVVRQPDHARDHVGVVAPAQLGALALVDDPALALLERCRAGS